MTIPFYICALVAFFVVLHGLVHNDETGTAFIIGLVLFLTCIWIANQYDITTTDRIRIEGEKE